MTEGQKYEWNIELDYMKSELRWVLDNLDSISKRYDVQNKIECIYNQLDSLCELTKGEQQ